MLLRHICLRYGDGREVCFVLEAGEEFFSRDDAHRVGDAARGLGGPGVAPGAGGQPGTQRFPGEGPYDTGAV